MSINRWSGLPLIIILLIGVILFSKRMDFFSMSEVRAFVSVVFVFSISCLLLSFIWIIQRKPMNSVWGLHCTNIIDTAPNMHPSGRTYSDASTPDEYARGPLCTVSSYIDRPPKYEEALISSKPINSIYVIPEKHQHVQSATSSTCVKHPNQIVQPPLGADSAPFCRACFDELIYNAVGRKLSTNNSMAQYALNLKKGVGSSVEPNQRRISHEHPSANMRTRSQPAYQSDTNASQSHQQQVSASSCHMSPRKVSFCQLDVSQLTQCGSPPKYSEISRLSPTANRASDFDEFSEGPRSSRQV